ncbi:hypothetical protein L9F63_018125 [Diploptera punctata]|uniref:Chitin-binding type-2 domain-containing protein n=1 Tax=Diploptera punctata TaxID=6984 RepID=A0AAD7ZXH7_DIPPU|nr:hypothetical protein L9F63_018125 [Diploptera punctata]
MAKEFGATSFEETSEEMASLEENGQASLAPKQHVKRLVSAERNVELQEYQGVMGRPGVDFPVLPSIPKTGFSCRQVKTSGYYADLDTDCQVFHICADGRKISFLCPNGTIFRQSHLICDWWWTVDCASSREHYEESAEMLANDRKIHQARSDALSKSRARQRSNRKPGIVREFEGASASVTSFSTEPNPRLARIEAHSKVINPNKHFPSSTIKPNQNVFFVGGSSRGSDEFQASGSMEQAEQRQFHAFHPPFPGGRSRRPITGQLPEGRETSQSRQHLETRPSVHNIPQLRDFKQNTPPTPRVSEQRQLAPSNEFVDLQPPPIPTPLSRQPFVTDQPQKNQFTIGQFQQNTPGIPFSQGRQTSQSRFTPTRQQVQSSQDFRPPAASVQNNQRQQQFRPENQAFSQSRESNGTKTYSHFRLFSSSDGERQLPAETGSFVSNRGNQLIKQTTPKTHNVRITPLPQNRFPQASNKSYVELDRSQVTTPKPTDKPLKVAHSRRVKPVVVQATDHDISDKDMEDATEHSTIDEEEAEDDDGFPEPPSEEQFKDEDLFYLHSTTESTTEEDKSNTENPINQEDEEEGEIDLESELGLSKPPSDAQFKDEDLGGLHNDSKLNHSAQTTPIPERSTAPSVHEEVSINSELSLADISTKTSHRFRTSTVSTSTPASSTVASPSVPQIVISSTLEPPTWKDFSDEDIVVVSESSRISKKPLVLDEEDDSSHTTTLATTVTEDIKTDEKTRVPSASFVSSATVPPSEESTKKRVTPIFLEIISRGSSEQPILKTFTVEELEKKHVMTESSLSTEEDISGSSTQRRFRSRTTTESTTRDLSVASSTESSSSPLFLSKRVRPPKQGNSFTSASPDSDKPTKSTIPIPPTTLYVTLSRRVQPPVLILSSTDPREQNKLKIPKTKESFRTRTKSTTEGSTTETISRRVRPPVTEVSSSTTPTPSRVRTGASSREPSESSISIQTVTASSPRALILDVDQLPIEEEENADDLLVTTNSPNKKLTSYVETQRRKTTITDSNAEGSTSTEPSSTNMFSRIKIEQTLSLKQEPTPAPQFGNRDGLDIPASSGPSTLHSLAVYIATKDGQTETTSPIFDSNSPFDSKKRRGKDKGTTTVSTPLTSGTPQLELTTANESDTSISSLKFLTQSTRDSYSSLFPNTKPETPSTSTSEQPITSTTTFVQKPSSKINSKERDTSDSRAILKTELLDKLAEISQMEAIQQGGKVTSEKATLHTDTEDLLQGTDSRDLRELAQIFSRALSAYLEDPEEFKKVLTEVRPKDPESLIKNVSITFDEILQQNSTVQPFISSSAGISLSSIDYSSSPQEDEEEVLDFSDVYKVSRKKTKSTTPLPTSLKSVKSTKKKSSTTTSTTISTIISTASSQNSSYVQVTTDTELKPPKERLQNAQTNYYSTRQQVGKNVSANNIEIELVTSSPVQETAADYTLPPGTKQYTGPGYGPQKGEGKFEPTAGGVNDPSRPRYGGFQNNTKLTRTPEETVIEAKIERILDTKAIVQATTLSPVSRTQIRSSLRPAVTRTSSEKNIDNKMKVKDVTDKIGGILNTFVPEDVNNLAVVSDMPDIENEEKDKKINSRVTTNETLVGANTASFTSSRTRQSSNQVNADKKWDKGAEVIDPLAINRELSASEEIVATVRTTEKPNSTTKGKVRSSTITTPPSTAEVNLSSDQIALVSTTSPKSTSTILSTKSSERTKQPDIYEDKESDSEEGLSSVIPDLTFYSERIKPAPPPSDSLIRSSSRKSNNLSSLSTVSELVTSVSDSTSENPINVSISKNNSFSSNQNINQRYSNY